MRLQTLSLSTASVLAIALGSTPAFAQTQPTATGPVPEACANIQDDAERQRCAEASERVDPNANSGDSATVPTDAPADAEGTQASSETIVVTGSRLRRDERTSADPLTVIDPTAEAREGKFDTAEVLQSNPLAQGSFQITSTISSNFVINGGEGSQSVSLRGLGANRTLVLLNGRRAGPAGTRGGVSSFDLNVIPTDALQTIDILKTGASSVYGSDAIAGVVNLITRKDLRGLQMRGFASVPTEGGGEQYSISGIYGLGLGDRGHAMIGASRYRINGIQREDREFFDCEEEYVFNEAGERVDPIDPRDGEYTCGNFLSNLAQVTDYGPTFGLGTNLTYLPNGRAINYIQYNTPFNQLDDILCQEVGAPANCATNIRPATGLGQFVGPAGAFGVGAANVNQYTLANFYDPRVNKDDVVPGTDRFTIFGEAGYELTDSVELYFEGLYNRRKTKTRASGQLFFDQFTGNTIIPQYGVGLPYFFCDGTTCDPYAAGDPLNTEFSGVQLLTPIITRPFSSSADVKYLRGVLGARADLSNLLPNGFADVYYQHSRSNGRYSRIVTYRDAIEFGVAEYRTELCEGTVTAIRGVPCIDIDYLDPRVLAGNFTPEEYDFLFTNDVGNTKYRQNTLEGTIGGDIFELPAGPLKVALGAQYRRDSINDVPGEATLSGNIFGSTTSGITKGVQITKEAFGEIEVPVFRDAGPGLQAFTLNAAARVTSTSAKSGTPCDPTDVLCRDEDADKGNWTYKLGANLQTTDWLRFRATIGTSFRSPALFEQFLANESGFLGQASDPCIQLNNKLAAGTISQRLYDNCIASGVPGTYLGGGSSAETFSQGGVGVLDPETSLARTFSVIFTPQGWFWNGGRFSLTVDYIDINVKGQVAQLGAANILTGCYSSDDFPNDPLCSLFVRDLNPNSSTAFNILTVNDPYLNIDNQRNKSIDVTARFRQDMGSWGSLSFLGQVTYQLYDKFELFQGFSANDNGEVGDPLWVADFNLSWAKAPFTVTYGLNVISKTDDLQDFKNNFGSQVTPSNCLNTAGGQALRGGIYCPIYSYPRVAYHSLSGEVEVGENYSFLFGVSNLFDKKPPLTSTVGNQIQALYNVPVNGTYYDYFGRRFFVSAKAKLGGF